MKHQHPPEFVAQLEANALHIPHGLFVTDRIIDIDVGAFVSTITFGHTPPTGAINPVATLQVSTPFLIEIATRINSAVAQSADQLKEELGIFVASLP